MNVSLLYDLDLSLLSTQAFPAVELKLLSTEKVDIESRLDWVLMRTNGEMVMVRPEERDGHQFLYFYTLQKLTKQGDSLDKKRIKWSCDSDHNNDLSFLFIQILWKEYLVISCNLCKDIKLVDMETLEVTTAFSDDQRLAKMCRGWHKIYVEVPSGFLELDCSSTKFTKIRDIRTNTYNCHWCYMPHPHNMMVTALGEPFQKGGQIRAASLDQPKDPLWCLFDKEEAGKVITPERIFYCSRYDALLVLDVKNKTVWALDPGTGEVIQSIDVPEFDQNEFLETTIFNYKHDYPTKVFLRGNEFVIVYSSKLDCFSFA